MKFGGLLRRVLYDYKKSLSLSQQAFYNISFETRLPISFPFSSALLLNGTLFFVLLCRALLSKYHQF